MIYGETVDGGLFIREQMIDTIYDLKPEFHDDRELLDVYIWSPTSCRWCRWDWLNTKARAAQLRRT